MERCGRNILLAALVALPFSVAHAAHDTVSISNLKAGKICWDDIPEVCVEARDVAWTDEGRYTYNREVHPCTWYRFSFDYEVTRDTALLECTFVSSEESNFENREELFDQNVNRATYEIELIRSSRRFVHPQYMLHRPDDPVYAIDIEQSCAYEDEVLFEVELRLSYPLG